VFSDADFLPSEVANRPKEAWVRTQLEKLIWNCKFYVHRDHSREQHMCQ
jgi:hypothetical protein